MAVLFVHVQCYADCLVEADGSANTSSHYHHHESSTGDDAGHDGDTGHDDDEGCLQQPFVGPQISIVNVNPILADFMMLPAAAHFDAVAIRPELLSRFETGSPPPILSSAAITILRV